MARLPRSNASVTPPVDGQREGHNDVPLPYVTWTGITGMLVSDGTAGAVGVAAITARRRNQPRLASVGRSSHRERCRLARAPSLRTGGQPPAFTPAGLFNRRPAQLSYYTVRAHLPHVLSVGMFVLREVEVAIIEGIDAFISGYHGTTFSPVCSGSYGVHRPRKGGYPKGLPIE
ncbi:hypothetical protein MRX96_017270, partial [Rhipicephalus microplus]